MYENGNENNNNNNNNVFKEYILIIDIWKIIKNKVLNATVIFKIWFKNIE